MKLTFYGAAKEVTGSAHLLEACGKRILIDCGLQQGADEKDNENLPFAANSIDFVLLTHAHIDHSGRLPLLSKNGFRGEIHTTGKTEELITIMLRDSAHIQENDAKWENQKGRRAGRPPVEPIYTLLDTEEVLQYVVPHPYGELFELASGVRVRFIDAGHLLGSASIEVFVTENGEEQKIVFSGDIGNLNQPIIRDPQPIREADYVVMESTYGDRNHERSESYTEDFAEIIDSTLARGGNVVIPSFAVGRTQELLYFIREIKERALVKSVPDFPVYVDSPLSTEATKIYDGNLSGYADEDTVKVLLKGSNPLRFRNLHLCSAVEESKLLNQDPTPKVIISSSGMCEAGRIRHHLKHNLWRPECSVVFVGFQAQGTLGRLLLDGMKTVKLFGEEIAVKAGIYNFRALSAHADQSGLVSWVRHFETKPKKIFIVHGEKETCEIFAEYLKSDGWNAYAPNFEAVYDLTENCLLESGTEPAGKPKAKAASSVFLRLLASGKRLMEVIKRNEGGSNKDLAKFADQINSLAEKWER